MDENIEKKIANVTTVLVFNIIFTSARKTAGYYKSLSGRGGSIEI